MWFHAVSCHTPVVSCVIIGKAWLRISTWNIYPVIMSDIGLRVDNSEQFAIKLHNDISVEFFRRIRMMRWIYTSRKAISKPCCDTKPHCRLQQMTVDAIPLIDKQHGHIWCRFSQFHRSVQYCECKRNSILIKLVQGLSIIHSKCMQ